MTHFIWNGSSGELKDLCEYEQMAEKKNFLRGGWVGRLMSLPPTDVQHRFPLVKLGPAGQKKEMIMMVSFCNGIFSSNFTLFYSQIGSILSQQFRALASHLGNMTSNQISWHTFVTAVFTQMEKLVSANCGEGLAQCSLWLSLGISLPRPGILSDVPSRLYIGQHIYNI